MLSSNIPTKFNIVWAKDAASPNFIRPIPETTVDPNIASLDLGFPPNTALPVGAGGTPPNIADFNGILQQLSAWSRWQAAGAPIFWDSTFSAAIGGYPAGATVSSLSGIGQYWISTVDNNVTNPDMGGAGWYGYTIGQVALSNAPGFLFDWPNTTPPTGSLERNGAGLSTTTYAALFAVIGYTFGGSGGTFDIPDDRGLFVRGWDDGASVDPGRVFGSFQGDVFGSHTHSTTYYDNNSPTTGAGHGGNTPLSASTGATGGTETRPKNRAYLPCIKF